MRSALCSVANDDCVGLFPHQSHYLVDRIDGTDRVGHVIEGDDSRSLVEQPAQEIEIDLPVWSQLANSELCALSQRQYLPRDEVRVVIERSHDDLVAARHVRVAPRSGDQIQSLGRAPGEDQAIGVSNPEKLCDADAGLVITLGCPYRE